MVIYFNNENKRVRMYTYNGLNDFRANYDKGELPNGHNFLLITGGARLGESYPLASFPDLKKSIEGLKDKLDAVHIEHFLNGVDHYVSADDMVARIKQIYPEADEYTVEDVLFNMEPNVYFEGYDDETIEKKIKESYSEILAE